MNLAAPRGLADEILDELERVYPGLLTRQELAERCPSGDKDPHKFALALRDLKIAGQVESVPKKGWIAAKSADPLTVEQPLRHKITQALPTSSTNISSAFITWPDKSDSSARQTTSHRDDTSVELANPPMEPQACTATPPPDALLAVTFAAQAARNALALYADRLGDPILHHLIDSTHHAERALERLNKGTAQEA